MNVTVIDSSVAEAWLTNLYSRDPNAAGRITARIARMESGNFGDAKAVGGGVTELRVDFGPGYRVYFARQGFGLIVVLCGGDKSTQKADIKLAKEVTKSVP